MAALRMEAAVGRIEAALVGNADDDDDLESVAGKGGRFQAETSRDRGQGKGYGYYGGRRSSAWYEKKKQEGLSAPGRAAAAEHRADPDVLALQQKPTQQILRP